MSNKAQLIQIYVNNFFIGGIKYGSCPTNIPVRSRSPDLERHVTEGLQNGKNPFGSSSLCLARAFFRYEDPTCFVG
jgi:hypothetical protein